MTTAILAASPRVFVITRTGAGLLAMIALAGLLIVGHLIIRMSKRSPDPEATRGTSANAVKVEEQVAFRRRGIKALVIGSDGRASTSKTQVQYRPLIMSFTVKSRCGIRSRARRIGPSNPVNGPWLLIASRLG
jgi:hypothetical protein